MLQGKWLSGDDDLTDAFGLRRQIFVEEIGYDEKIEFDDHDDICIHLVVYENQEPVATGRMEWLSDFDTIHMGRICVRRDKRNQRIGDFLVRVMLDKAFRAGASTVEIFAKEEVTGFYQKLGFKDQGPVEEVTGTPHHKMTCQALPVSPCQFMKN